MTTAIRLVTGSWDALGTDAAAVRIAVFVQEQQIAPELEWDEHDAVCLHCVAYAGAQPVGTGRLLADGHIGRMAVLADYRRGGLGGRILERLVDRASDRGDEHVILSAQTYVLGFYRQHGFVARGEVYEEVGIPHQEMTRALWGGEVVAQAWSETPPGLRLRDWQPTRDHGAGIYLLHGLGEHSGRYDALARWLCVRGWWVRGHDHIGHGDSRGPRGVIDRPDALRIDAAAQIERFARELGSAPLLLGHSMGGALAAELVVSQAVAVSGLILSSPALTIALSPPMQLLATLLQRMAPTLALPNGLNPDHLSHDMAQVRAYRDDPLVHNRICARLLGWLAQAGETARAGAPNLSVPTLLLVAGADRLVEPEGSRAFAARTPAELTTLKWYDGLFHELFNESAAERQMVLDDLAEWLTPLAQAPR